MDKESLKREIGYILQAALSGQEERYRYDVEGYSIRWGAVEKDIYAEIDRHLTTHKDLTACPKQP